eukprot:365979-Chlamydomonas_euryale.AAC.6
MVRVGVGVGDSFGDKHVCFEIRVQISNANFKCKVAAGGGRSYSRAPSPHEAPVNLTTDTWPSWIITGPSRGSGSRDLLRWTAMALSVLPRCQKWAGGRALSLGAGKRGNLNLDKPRPTMDSAPPNTGAGARLRDW